MPGNAKSLISSSPLIFKTTLSGSTHFTGEDFEAEKGQDTQSHSGVGVRAVESAEFQNLADPQCLLSPEQPLSSPLYSSGR